MLRKLLSLPLHLVCLFVQEHELFLNVQGTVHTNDRGVKILDSAMSHFGILFF
jgi:hypothetical protein